MFHEKVGPQARCRGARRAPWAHYTRLNVPGSKTVRAGWVEPCLVDVLKKALDWGFLSCGMQMCFFFQGRSDVGATLERRATPASSRPLGLMREGSAGSPDSHSRPLTCPKFWQLFNFSHGSLIRIHWSWHLASAQFMSRSFGFVRNILWDFSALLGAFHASDMLGAVSQKHKGSLEEQSAHRPLETCTF